MSLLITILQIFGLFVLVAIAIGFAARMTHQARAAREANRVSRLGVDARTRVPEHQDTPREKP